MAVSLLLLAVSAVAGCLGSILGIGGGIILIPALTLGFGVGIHEAVGASLVSVIATSSGAAAIYLKDHLTNVRVAIFLEIATTSGALIGVFLGTSFNPRFLYVAFALVLFHSAYSMRNPRKGGVVSSSQDPKGGLAKVLKLDSEFFDPEQKKITPYTVQNIPLGFLYMLGAGITSGLLGIGSGALKVLAMDRAMGIPIKVSSATSNFMIGVTAAASASIYYSKGVITPELAAPVALGVLVGAMLGTRLLLILPAKRIRQGFAVLLLLLGIQMCMKGVGYGIR
jgi:uncharacterized membrane protein YfcA